MGFGGKDNLGEPAAEVGEDADPSHIQEGGELVFHDDGLVDSVPGRSAGNRCGRACVNAELVVEDRAVDAGGGEGVPVGLDDAGQYVFMSKR